MEEHSQKQQSKIPSTICRNKDKQHASEKKDEYRLLIEEMESNVEFNSVDIVIKME